MIEFEKPNIKCLELDEVKNYAKFVCEPLERGYGITIGNSLRRILLSSLPGSAITSVKIDGVLHEFTTIPDVVEDVSDIILNLKMVRLKLDKNEVYILDFTEKNKRTCRCKSWRYCNRWNGRGIKSRFTYCYSCRRWTFSNGNDCRNG